MQNGRYKPREADGNLQRRCLGLRQDRQLYHSSGDRAFQAFRGARMG
jgi:hypothetical protein